MLSAFVLTLFVLSASQSQPAGGKQQTKNPQVNQTDTRKELDAIRSELSSIVRETSAIREKATEIERHYADQKASGVVDRRLEVATLIVLALGVVAAVWTLTKMERQISVARDAANAAKASADGLKNSERAYVSIRHQQADDKWEEGDIGLHKRGNREGDFHRHRLDFRIENSGRTPAHILGGIIQHVRDLPAHSYEPPRDITNDRGHIPGNYLPAQDRYRQKMDFMLTMEEMTAISDSRLWLVGYVDYRDAFKALHRAGFCRRVKHSSDTKNNMFVDITCEPYNYDTEIDEQGNPKPEAK
ncbi:MAG TPA: hypothetical protein VES67_11645 [Vicinamibacterales bacterium]|nr:hypothetical protein [Vicinamibacterales bacterium]